MSILESSNTICKFLHETYNAYWLNKYPEIKDIFIEVIELYLKHPSKYLNANQTLMTLIFNLSNQEYLPNVDYITGPGVISKWEDYKSGKIFYLFGENDHSNLTGCKKAVQLARKKHLSIQDYLSKLFKYSPVFIDFYIEVDIMLDWKEEISTTTEQTLWDMLIVMSDCFGPLEDRNCPYNVRMHAVDVRTIKSNKYDTSKLDMLTQTLMMEVVLRERKNSYISVWKFKKLFVKEISKLSTVKTDNDLIKIIINKINNNKLLLKEINRSTLSYKTLIDFFVKTELNARLSKLDYSEGVGIWFKSLSRTDDIWPPHLNIISYIITLINAVTMDIYTAARMFKVFNVKKDEYYPKEPQNIIYYAGTGHTQPMARFFNKLGFSKTEHSDSNILSCISMKGIQQPLFKLN